MTTSAALALVDPSPHSLPSLVQRAASHLSGATNAAEVLEARDIARVAYDAAKSAARFARAKQAHDDVLSAVYRAQADALEIEALAKRRLADEYDEAQERGEVATRADQNLLLDIEHFAQCFPRKIGFTDLDAFVELNGHFLILEFKENGSDLTTGQRLAFERLTAISERISIVVVRCDYRTSEVFGIKPIRNGKSGDWRACDYERLLSYVSAWADRVSPVRLVAESSAA